MSYHYEVSETKFSVDEAQKEFYSKIINSNALTVTLNQRKTSIKISKNTLYKICSLSSLVSEEAVLFSYYLPEKEGQLNLSPPPLTAEEGAIYDGDDECEALLNPIQQKSTKINLRNILFIFSGILLYSYFFIYLIHLVRLCKPLNSLKLSFYIVSLPMLIVLLGITGSIGIFAGVERRRVCEELFKKLVVSIIFFSIVVMGFGVFQSKSPCFVWCSSVSLSVFGVGIVAIERKLQSKENAV